MKNKNISIKQFCIDESGDTGYTKKSSKYFVLCAVGTEDLDILRRIARDIHRIKYNKSKGNILHAYKESDTIKNKIIKKLTKQNIASFVVVADKTKIKEDDLYLYATRILAENFKDQNVELIIVARRDNRKSYAQKILDIYKSNNIIAEFSDPAKDKSLQIADFYSWATFVKYEKVEDEYFDKLGNILLL